MLLAFRCSDFQRFDTICRIDQSDDTKQHNVFKRTILSGYPNVRLTICVYVFVFLYFKRVTYNIENGDGDVLIMYFFFLLKI